MTVPVFKDTLDKQDEFARQIFTPAEFAALCKLTENADESVKDSYHYDLILWACENRIAETHGVKLLHGIFSGKVHLVEVYANGKPHFVIEHGARL